MHDLLSVADAVIFPGDGAAHFKVEFRMIIFRPFVGEVLRGVVRSSTREGGINVTLGFFDDIVIPPSSMAEDTTFDDQKQLWVWTYRGEDGTTHDFDIVNKEEICFKVTAEKFVDITPFEKLPPHAQQQEVATNAPQVPYMIEGNIEEFGLGMTSWWSL